MTDRRTIEIVERQGYREVWVTSERDGFQPVRFYSGRALTDESLALLLRVQGYEYPARIDANRSPRND
jgi:hypothetical protein